MLNFFAVGSDSHFESKGQKSSLVSTNEERNNDLGNAVNNESGNTATRKRRMPSTLPEFCEVAKRRKDISQSGTKCTCQAANHGQGQPRKVDLSLTSSPDSNIVLEISPQLLQAGLQVKCASAEQKACSSNLTLSPLVLFNGSLTRLCYLPVVPSQHNNIDHIVHNPGEISQSASARLSDKRVSPLKFPLSCLTPSFLSNTSDLPSNTATTACVSSQKSAVSSEASQTDFSCTDQMSVLVTPSNQISTNPISSANVSAIGKQQSDVFGAEKPVCNVATRKETSTMSEPQHSENVEKFHMLDLGGEQVLESTKKVDLVGPKQNREQSLENMKMLNISEPNGEPKPENVEKIDKPSGEKGSENMEKDMPQPSKAQRSESTESVATKTCSFMRKSDDVVAIRILENG